MSPAFSQIGYIEVPRCGPFRLSFCAVCVDGIRPKYFPKPCLSCGRPFHRFTLERRGQALGPSLPQAARGVPLGQLKDLVAQQRDYIIIRESYASFFIVAFCARAASGHAAAPPSSVMNARRLVGRERSILRDDGGRFTTSPPSRPEAR